MRGLLKASVLSGYKIQFLKYFCCNKMQIIAGSIYFNVTKFRKVLWMNSSAVFIISS